MGKERPRNVPLNYKVYKFKEALKIIATILVHLGAALELSWRRHGIILVRVSLLGLSGAIWGLSWTSLGAILGHLGAVLELLGSSWCVVLLSWASLGPSLGCFGPLLGLFWTEITLWDEHGITWRGHWRVCAYL